MKIMSLICLFCLSVMSQIDETVIIEQTGKGNRAFFDDHLSLKYNEAMIIQNGNYNGTAFDLNGDGVNDPTTIIIETPASKATIEEYGNYNSALLHQRVGSPTTGSIYQDGNWNCAILLEGEAASTQVIQSGDRNFADIEQYYEMQTLYTLQNGNKNYLKINQHIESYLQATQIGVDNCAIMDADVFSNMSLYQEGNKNHSEQIHKMQDFGQSSCSVYQNGNNNMAYQDQGSPCEADIQQLSDENYASQYQRNITDNYDDRVYAQIIQSGGIGNEASQTQIGTRLSSTIIQTGSYNKAESYQGN